MFYYESHLYGNFFSSENELEYKDLYCEECGDSDSLIGEFESDEECQEYLDRRR